MTAVGRPAPACHPRAWPLHGGRDARHASPFPDSSPPPGERIKERGTHRASGVEGRGGTHPEARGGASGPPHPPLSPQGERERRTRIAREDDRSGGTARGGMTAVGRPPPACHPRAWPLHGGRDARRVRLLFLIPLPRRGRGSRRGGDAPRKRSRRERGDAPGGSRWRQRPPSPFPLPPRGEGDKNEQCAGE